MNIEQKVDEMLARQARTEARVTTGFNHLGVDTGPPRVDIQYMAGGHFEVQLSSLGVPLSQIADFMIANGCGSPVSPMPVTYKGVIICTVGRDLIAALRRDRHSSSTHGECNVTV